MKTIVVGLGNPILGDDGVGWKVAEELERQLPEGADIDIECLSLGGIGLMEHLIGYPRAILIDALFLDEPPGSISVLQLSDLPDYSAFHVSSAHDTSLRNALELGRTMGAELPQDVTVVGIVAVRVHEFSEELSPPILEAVPQAAQIVLNLLQQNVTLL